MFACDRCGKDITDMVSTFEASHTVSGFTGGYYKDWFEPGRVCDCCMWLDPRYIAQHGQQGREGCNGEA